MLYCPKREEINPRDLGLGKSQGEVRGSNVFFINQISNIWQSQGEIFGIFEVFNMNPDSSVVRRQRLRPKKKWSSKKWTLEKKKLSESGLET